MKNPDNRITVLCYGDSNTYGYVPGMEHGRYSRNERWTGILADRLGSTFEVIEEGLNGRTTAYDRYGSSFQNGLVPFEAILCTHKPLDLVIIMLGTNDCNKEMNLEPGDIKKGMEKLIRLVKDTMIDHQDYIPEILIIAPAVIKDRLKGSTFEDQLDETSLSDSRALAKLYKELADEYDCMYLDAGDIEVSDIDCEHLTIKGHKDLSEAVYKKIKEKF